MKKIPLVDLKANYKSIKAEIDKAIQNTINKTAFIGGNETELFEEHFAYYSNRKYGIGTSSGTTALELALRSLDIGEGDEVITTPVTFFATVESILNVGAKPVFVDIDPNTGCIGKNNIEYEIKRSTKAIIPVHLYGNTVSIDYIKNKYGFLSIIDDAAQAHGADITYGVNKKGDISCYSFYPGKNLGAFGDGGIVITDNRYITEKIKKLRDHGRSSKYTHEVVGYNYRLDNLQAAILDVKLKYLDKWNKKRREKAKFYYDRLEESNIPIEFLDYSEDSVYHLFVIKCEKRDKLKKYLNENNIGVGIHYPIPLHLQPALKKFDYSIGDFPEAEEFCSKILSLPLYSEITREQQEYICKKIEEFYQKVDK